MPPKCFESEVESFLEGSHGDRTHIKRADHHTVTPLCGTLLAPLDVGLVPSPRSRAHLPLEVRMGASLSPLVTDFPRDSSHFAEKASDPYI